MKGCAHKPHTWAEEVQKGGQVCVYKTVKTFSSHIPRAPQHKFSKRMSEVSEVEPLGVFDLDPASNHGHFFQICWSQQILGHLLYIVTLHNTDLIKVSSIINDYAAVLDEETGQKMKICTHADQGQSEKHKHNYDVLICQIIGHCTHGKHVQKIN